MTIAVKDHSSSNARSFQFRCCDCIWQPSRVKASGTANDMASDVSPSALSAISMLKRNRTGSARKVATIRSATAGGPASIRMRLASCCDAARNRRWRGWLSGRQQVQPGPISHSSGVQGLSPISARMRGGRREERARSAMRARRAAAQLPSIRWTKLVTRQGHWDAETALVPRSPLLLQTETVEQNGDDRQE